MNQERGLLNARPATKATYAPRALFSLRYVLKDSTAQLMRRSLFLVQQELTVIPLSCMMHLSALYAQLVNTVQMER